MVDLETVYHMYMVMIFVCLLQLGIGRRLFIFFQDFSRFSFIKLMNFIWYSSCHHQLKYTKTKPEKRDHQIVEQKQSMYRQSPKGLKCVCVNVATLQPSMLSFSLCFRVKDTVHVQRNAERQVHVKWLLATIVEVGVVVVVVVTVVDDIVQSYK